MSALIATAVLACLPEPGIAAPDPASRAGIWTMAMDGSNRQCRVQLRTDGPASGLALSMPPGCHRALPVLNGVSGWMAPDENHVAFVDPSGQTVLLFEEGPSGGLHAPGAEAEAGYTLTSIGDARIRPASHVEAASAGDTIAPASVKTAPALTIAAVAGHYAVLRGDRDTGCMVTLDEKERGPKTSLKARLAPACRDQGIVIFDPIGWQLVAGHLVLTARKGHQTDLDRDQAGLWTKDPGAAGRALTLKRL